VIVEHAPVVADDDDVIAGVAGRGRIHFASKPPWGYFSRNAYASM
jgi:hypothetical protein